MQKKDKQEIVATEEQKGELKVRELDKVSGGYGYGGYGGYGGGGYGGWGGGYSGGWSNTSAQLCTDDGSGWSGSPWV